MRKLSILFITLLFSSSVIFAQNDDHKLVFSANAGFSLVGGLIGGSSIDSDDNYSSYSIPAFQVNADYGIAKFFSAGVGVSYQMMGIDYTNYGVNSDNFSTDITRLNIGVRALFHYANSGRLDMYSGVRLGTTIWGVSVEGDIEGYDFNDYILFDNGTNFATQFILFGFRGYFTENLGANFEIGIGAPHFLSAGLTYRL